MRYLILSDIHGNREALLAVAADARGKYDRILCCGDLCDYGPDSNFAIAWVRAAAFAVIRGNHDRICSGLDSDEEFSELAQISARWTREQLTPENRTYLRELPIGPMRLDDRLVLVHGSPLGEDDYVTNTQEAGEIFNDLGESGGLSLPVFFGHTHVQGGFLRKAGGMPERIARPASAESEMTLRLNSLSAYLINCGSVGQPRDGDTRAAYALFDADLGEIRLCRVPYDYETTAKKILAAGLPERLAMRLSIGR